MKVPSDSLSGSAPLQGCALFSFAAFTACKTLTVLHGLHQASGGDERLFFAVSSVLLLFFSACDGILSARREKNGPPFFLPAALLCGLLSVNARGLPGIWQTSLMTACALLLPACLMQLKRFCPKADIRFLTGGLAAGAVLAAFCPDSPYPALLLLPGLAPAVAGQTPRRLIPSVFLGVLVLLPAVLFRHEQPGPEPLFPPRTAAPPPEVRAVYNALMTTCAEYSAIPDSIRIIGTGKTDVSLDSISREVLRDSTVSGDLRTYFAGDVFRTAQGTRPDEKQSGKDAGKKQAEAAQIPQVVLIAASHPENFQGNFWYTEECFRQIGKILAPGGILAVLLPDSFSSESSLSVCAALKQCFPHVIRMHTPGMLLLASDTARLTTDPDELNERAIASGLYIKMLAPFHLLDLTLPLYQTPEEDAAFLKEAETAVPNRADAPRTLIRSFASWRSPALLPVPAVLLLLYLALRYFSGWKPERKRRFRMFEAGLYFAGIVFYCCFLRVFAPAQNLFRDFAFTGLLPLLLGAALSRAGKPGVFSRILLPGVLIAVCVAFLPQTPRALIILMSAAAGFPMAYELKRAAAPVPDQNSHAMFFAGAGAAALLFPPLFLLSGGIYLTAGLLLLLLAMRFRS